MSSFDNFFVSFLFNNQDTKASAQKIENTVSDLKNKILSSFTAIAAFDFLKNAVKSTIELSTQLDNLSYRTNVSKDNLFAWGEAAKRSGGTAESFYSSVSSLSDKIMEMQTNFGSAGQLVFARLGVNLRDSNGKIKETTDVLKELGDKFKDMPKAFQFNLGKQLGLDTATIRMISDGSANTEQLIKRMSEYSQISNLNTERNIKLRNSLYDISLIFQSIKLKLANDLIPLVQKFSDYFVGILGFLEKHSALTKTALLVVGALLSGFLLSSILSVTRALIAMSAALATTPIGRVILVLSALALAIDDVSTYLRGGKSAFEDYYKTFEKYFNKFEKFIDYTKKIREFFGLKEGQYLFQGFNDELKKQQDYFQDKSIKQKIIDTANELGVNPSVALQVAQNESGLNPNAKNPTSSASGIFQLTDATALASGLHDISKKNDIDANIRAGIVNLKNVTDGLAKYFGRQPTANEVGLGERLGVEGSKKIFSAPSNTPLSNLFNDSVLNANPAFKTMTNSQLINQSSKNYNSKSVTVGQVKINAPNSNAREISQNLSMELQKQFSMLVTNLDNGVIA